MSGNGPARIGVCPRNPAVLHDDGEECYCAPVVDWEDHRVVQVEEAFEMVELRLRFFRRSDLERLRAMVDEELRAR